MADVSFSSDHGSTDEVSAPHDAFTITLYVIEVILCIMAIMLYIAFFYVTKKCMLIHRNLRILLRNQTIALMIMVIVRLVLNVVYFHNIFNHLNNEDTVPFRQDFFLCKSLSAVYDCAFYVAVLMFVVVAIERGVACVRSSTYEGQGIQLAVCLQITVLLIALVLVAINVRNETIDYFAWETASGTMETTLTCAQIFLSPKALLVCALSITVLNITSLAGYIAVYRINMGRFERVVDKGGAHSLSERFQINEIIKAMRLLFPSIAVIQLENIITICIIIYVSSQIHYKKANDKDIVRLWNMEQLYNISAVMFALCEPLVRMIFHDSLRKRFRKVFICCCSNSTQKRLHNIDFSTRKKIWFTDHRTHPTMARIFDGRGRLLTLTADQERILYFKRLSSSWK